MRYKIFSLLLFFVLFSCVTKQQTETKKATSLESFFLTKGFTLVYSENLYEKKLIKGKIDDRSLIIFQKNLKKNTSVKITNLLNSKYIIAKVGNKKDYPLFYNSVISERIFNQLEIDKKEPYVEVIEVVESSTFLAKKAKTFDEEKEVAEKAPVDSISINDLSLEKKETVKIENNKNFKYIIKVADFYYKNTAIMMKKRIINETKIKNVKINKLSSNTFRVYLGPFKDLKSIEKAFNDMVIIDFENLEIIKQ